MENNDINNVIKLPKFLYESNLHCAAKGQKQDFFGRSTFDESKKFRVHQNRVGHLNSNFLTYILFSNKSKPIIRIDLNGKSHHGIPTPHVHIMDKEHHNGQIAIPLSDLNDYQITDDVVNSLKSFLAYTNFETNNLTIDEKLV